MRQTVNEAMKFLKRYWITIPTALAIYGMVLNLVWPSLTVIGHRFASDVANSTVAAQPFLQDIVNGLVYVAFIALALIICVILLGSVAAGISLVAYEVVSTFIKLWRAIQYTMRDTAPRRNKRQEAKHASPGRVFHDIPYTPEAGGRKRGESRRIEVTHAERHPGSSDNLN